MWSTEEQGSRHRSVSHRVSVACHRCRISSLSHQSHLICAASHHIVSHRMSRRSAAHQCMSSPKTAHPAYLISSCPQEQGSRQRVQGLGDKGAGCRELSKPLLSLPKCRFTGLGQQPQGVCESLARPAQFPKQRVGAPASGSFVGPAQVPRHWDGAPTSGLV